MSAGITIDALEQRSIPEPNSGCTLWIGALRAQGYGSVYDKVEKKWKTAHRIAYELLVGPIPDGLQLDHLCRNRSCINVRHLEPVTRRINILRGISPSAKCAAKTECKNGHPFSTENTYLDIYKGSIGRRCQICRKAGWKRSKATLKARRHAMLAARQAGVAY